MNERIRPIATRLILGGSAVGTIIGINIIDYQPSPVQAADSTPVLSPVAEKTPTATPTLNPIARRVADEQKQVTDLRAKLKDLQDQKESLDTAITLRNEVVGLQTQVALASKVVDLQRQKASLEAAKELKQEEARLQEKINALNGTPTKTATPTATGTVTPTWTKEQIDGKKRAGLIIDTATGTPTVTGTPTATGTPGPGISHALDGIKPSEIPTSVPVAGGLAILLLANLSKKVRSAEDKIIKGAGTIAKAPVKGIGKLIGKLRGTTPPAAGGTGTAGGGATGTGTTP